jgi:hypothetical protein
MDNAKLPCSDKLVFETRKEAAAAANVAQWQHGASMKPYLCSHCNLWHLSSS